LTLFFDTSFQEDTDVLRIVYGDSYAQKITVGSGGGGGSVGSISPYTNPALAATKQSIKTDTGSIHGWTLINFNTVPVYVKLFDLALASVTVGTTVPAKIIPIPAGSASNPAIFFLETQQVEQHLFANAIVIAAVTGIADASVVAPATPLYVEVRFK
jgi:hypothetical protein